LYLLKLNPTTIAYYDTEMESEPGPPRVIDSPNLPRDTQVKVTLVSRPLLTPVARKSCAGVNMVYSRAERVFILEHYFASKSFAAVYEAFSKMYPDKEVRNKTTVHRLVTKFRDTGSVFDRKCVRSRTVLTGETLRNLEETLALSTTTLLQQFFGGHIVRRGLWPPPSTDLTPPNFFLWVFLKESVHSKNPRSFEE
jgi:hypothetical protein